MEKETRSAIQRATQAARTLLEAEVGEQLTGTFDIRADGTVAGEAGAHLRGDNDALRARARLVAAVRHHRDQGRGESEAVAALTRECAFTLLNRLVALKMLEARGIVLECVSKGAQSAGFKEFSGLCPGLTALPDQGYRLYLESVFDELGVEVRVLFDRRDSAGLIWPRKPALDAVLGIVNGAELSGPTGQCQAARVGADTCPCVWCKDETIGWVYQYFNGEDERRDMRAASQAPRNSRELAVRNQFFTPRYVVEFLADNTLARTWVEMRQGDTRFTEDRAYLVRRPGEVFLADGAAVPTAEAGAEESPTYVPFRAKKDPRDLKVLDPACGSGHFLLYSFDLLLTIYEEAWADPAAPRFADTKRTLAEDYPTLPDLRRALPGLILRHNLHGVDIDPRAAQIAALALWMRAQKAWNQFGVKRGDRPLVTRTNVVVAEPMPGEPDLLDELCRGLDPGVAEVVRAVFEEMKLAGEAGMLLRVDETVRRGLEKLASLGPMYAQEGSRRWQQIDAKVTAALRAYAEAAGGAGYRKRLFAEDAAQGFAFVEVCRQRYDVVLMNPPFGASSLKFKDKLAKTWPRSKQDVYAAFVERGVSALPPGGLLGAITSRTGFFLKSFQAWREEVVLKQAPPSVVADLGAGVLDSAMVETAAYCLRRADG
jgi:hypothetical protein